MTLWTPDSCDCLIEIERNELIKKCPIHSTATETLKHNRTLNNSFDSDKTETEQMNQVIEAKKKFYNKVIENKSIWEKIKGVFGF